MVLATAQVEEFNQEDFEFLQEVSGEGPHKGLEIGGPWNPIDAFMGWITVHNDTDKPIVLVSARQTPIVKGLLQKLGVAGKKDGASFSLGLKPHVQQGRCARLPIEAGAKQAVYIKDSTAYLSAFVLVDGSADPQQAHGVDVPMPCGRRVIISGITMDSFIDLPDPILVEEHKGV